mgnify:CR=1 FL=1
MKKTLSIFSRTLFRWIIQAVLLIPTVLFPQSSAIQTDVPALKEVYRNDFYIGCLLSYAHVGFATDPFVLGQSAVVDPLGGPLIQFHMNSMSPGNNMKPAYILDIAASAAAYRAASAAQKDSIDVHPIVKLNGNIIAQLNWAQRQGFTFRGHTLVWHSQTPAEFFRSGYTGSGARLSKEKMIERLDHYIAAVIGVLHEGWPGLLSAMDVVNEAVNENGSDRTTDSEWYLTIGDNSYVFKAFELTRKHSLAYGEGQIKLYYNDYNTHVPSKADGIVRLCTPIFQAGYLDGIGMQEHDSHASPTAEQWIASYEKFYPICTEMAVTELDVTTGSATPSAAVLATQAKQYGQLFKCFVERSYFSGRGKIISVSKDGLNDQWTFKKNQSSSLWDAQNQCKPAFFAVVQVGKHFNSLDSLLAFKKTLAAESYTSDSWTVLVQSADSARMAMKQNYSSAAAVSTAEVLAQAHQSLQQALNGLIKNTAVVADLEILQPNHCWLAQNYPNPFNPRTRIDFVLNREGSVQCAVYDLLGRKVKELVNQSLAAGPHSFYFDGTDLESGSYFYTLRTSNYMDSKTMLLIK